MNKRFLGKSGLQVSAIGFGCMGLDYAYSNQLTKQESITLLRAAFDRGVKLHRLEENNGAAAVVLTAADLNEINAALEKIKVAGERYPEELEKRTGL